MSQPIRILIADDSALFVEALSAVLQADVDLTIVGVARNGRDAVRMAQELAPNLITMDVHMPAVDGIVAVEEIMSTAPTPILVMTGDARSQDNQWVFELLSRGALDVVSKSDLLKEDRETKLVEHIKLLSSVSVVHHRARPRTVKRANIAPVRAAFGANLPHLGSQGPLVGMVASTGGPSTVVEILAALPSDFAAPIVLVQHLAPEFTSHFATWLESSIRLKVALATPGTSLQCGTVYVAPASVHTVVGPQRRIQHKPGTMQELHLPSGSVLLSSIAKSCADRSIGVILTGMGQDGASGLADIRNGGGVTIVQEPSSCVVDGMAQAARAMGATMYTSWPEEIPALLTRSVARILGSLRAQT